MVKAEGDHSFAGRAGILQPHGSVDLGARHRDHRVLHGDGRVGGSGLPGAARPFQHPAAHPGLIITGFGFLAVYPVPFVKYPANPPSIGHTFTVATRTALYLTMVGCSLLFLIFAAVLGRRLQSRFGNFNATLIAGVAFIVAISIVIGLLPSLGHLAANKRVDGSIGYGPSATETPLPVTNPRGQIVYPGFPADVLWKFRFYSLLAQMIVWGAIGMIFGAPRTLLQPKSESAAGS